MQQTSGQLQTFYVPPCPFFEIAPGIRQAVHQPSCSFRHNSAAIPSKNPDGSIAARLRKRSGASERIGRHPAAPPDGTARPHAPLRLASPINFTGLACTDTFKWLRLADHARQLAQFWENARKAASERPCVSFNRHHIASENTLGMRFACFIGQNGDESGFSGNMTAHAPPRAIWVSV